MGREDARKRQGSTTLREDQEKRSASGDAELEVERADGMDAMKENARKQHLGAQEKGTSESDQKSMREDRHKALSEEKQKRGRGVDAEAMREEVRKRSTSGSAEPEGDDWETV